MPDPSPRPEGSLTTAELAAFIELEFGQVFSRDTIRSWVLREENPLPVAYKGKRGQAHYFDREEFLRWYTEELDRQAKLGEPLTEEEAAELENIDRLDWHSAKTISARERAKKDIIETRKLEHRYAEVNAMERAAEDAARQAVNMLRTIPSRLAPVCAERSDELELYQLLDAEIRAVCQAIEKATLAGLNDDEPPPDQQQQQTTALAA